MYEIKPYPYQCCEDCGRTAQIAQIEKETGKRYTEKTLPVRYRKCSSVWIGVCDVCDKETSITEVRDYGYPYFKNCKQRERTTIYDGI